MAPETRSGGAPAPSRVYHSTPALQQAHFPARRRAVHTYGSERKRNRDTPSSTLRQQTLTQLDFVSSFEEDGDGPIVLSDSDTELELGADDGDVDTGVVDKENRRPSLKVEKHVELEQEEEDADDDEEPVASGRIQRASSLKRARKQNQESKKRRRTLGDRPDAHNTKDKESRRKTLGDPPSSNYHTQTLTQFMGRHSFIQDSDDEIGEDDGFEDWLGQPGSPSPLPKKVFESTSAQQNQPSPSLIKSKENPPASQAESVVPQTPAKRIRFEIPSSSQQTTPLSAMMDRYSPLGDQASPLKGTATPLPEVLPGKAKAPTPASKTRAKLVVEDSFATGSWGSGDRTPTKRSPLKSQVQDVAETAASSPARETSSLSEAMSTPSKKPAPRGESTELGERATDNEKQKKTKTPSPKKRIPSKPAHNGLFEIPDSDEDDEDFDDDNDNDEQQEKHDTFVAGPETQFALSELASSEEAAKTSTCSTPRPTSTAPETTLLKSPSNPSPTLPPAKRLRKPLQHAPRQPTQTQFMESQRVPVDILRSLPPAAIRTDILLPVSPSTLASILAGTQIHVQMPFKVPDQVVRFWFFDGALLRYMASAEPASRQADGSWHYHLPQVYELNNPLSHNDMQEEGWVEKSIERYIYIPPAVVSQMLWNLRHALFGEGVEDEDAPDDPPASSQAPQSEPMLPPPGSRAKNKTPSPSLSVSQQLEAQIQSDIAQSTQFPHSGGHSDDVVPSTPEEGEEAQDDVPELASMAPPARSSRLHPQPPSSSHRPYIRPSQATTVSQASTDEPGTSPSQRFPLSSQRHCEQPSEQTPLHHSSSNLTFQDYGSVSSLQLPSGAVLPSSQLLTRSQMLPDSLLRDDTEAPPEIWDSEDEEPL